VTNADNSRWAYSYDSLGQVTSGKRYWSDGVPVAGQQYEYSFDDIGNRKVAADGGNEWGTALRYQNYTVNSLNQYTQRTVPGAVDILGAASSNATVTVNLKPTYRHGDYFRREMPVTNSAAIAYQAATNVGVLANGTNADIVTTNAGFVLIPKTPEVYVSDLDGNLTTNGLWILTWDAENRLIALDPASGVPDSAKRKLRFSYDFQGRRISKVVSNYSGGSWVLGYSTKFVYDGWNLLTEINATNSAVLRSYMWGLDVSSSPQGAGGVGGLLTMWDSSGSVATNCFYSYDGNGNVRGLVGTSDGKLAVEYEYGSFGEPIKAVGSAAKNVFTFSTKYCDSETGWRYYGFRYLSDGKWLSRDPIGERGGPNLCQFAYNDPINNVDRLGFDIVKKDPYEGYDKDRNVTTYNCAGLAFRNYQIMSLTETKK
jgi:RHS repeat-associated protein